MSASAIVMMCIACVGLWGGGILSLVIMLKNSKKSPGEIIKEIEEAEPETFINQ